MEPKPVTKRNSQIKITSITKPKRKSLSKKNMISTSESERQASKVVLNNQLPNATGNNIIPFIPNQPQYIMQPGINFQQPIQQVYINNIQGQIIQPDQNIINNQIMPPPLPQIPSKFGKYQMEFVCPYCQQLIKTKIEENFNCCTCIFCCMVSVLLVFALCAGGEGSCSGDCSCSSCECKCCIDVKHFCPNCGQKLGENDSCKRLCPCLNLFC